MNDIIEFIRVGVKSAKIKPIAITLILCIGISKFISFAADMARSTNQKFISNTYIIEEENNYETGYYYSDLLCNNLINIATPQNQNSETVNNLMLQLPVIEKSASNFHFESLSNLLFYLIGLNQHQTELSCIQNYINNNIGDDDDQNEYVYSFLRYLYFNPFYLNCIEDEWERGNYYRVRELTDMYFLRLNFLKEQSYTDLDVYELQCNNCFYLIKLITQYRWELTTHRDFAGIIGKIIFKNVSSEKEPEQLFLQLNNFDLPKNLDLFRQYLNGTNALDKKEYQTAQNIFCNIYETSDQVLLKEFSAFMVCRTAFWIYDRNPNKENLAHFQRIYSQYSNKINKHYLLVDIAKYQEIVQENKMRFL